MTDPRKQGIGASEAAAALGLSPYMTPLALYQRKTGEAEDDGETLPMRVGKALEPVVLHAFEEREGVRVTHRQDRVPHPSVPWLWATLDGLTSAPPAVVEAKTSASRDGWGEDGTDQVRQDYLVQTQVQLMVTGLEIAWVPVLFAGRDLRVYRVPAAPDLQDVILRGLREFWARVEAREPPEPTTPEDVVRRWPRDSGAVALATPELEAVVEELRAVRDEVKLYEAKRDALESTIKRAMTDAATLEGSRGVLATWRTQSARRVDMERLKAEYPDVYEACRTESQSRVFRLAKPRE